MVVYDKGRQGIALIIVLGMLSIMMVMGVAFVITMRTERVAAGNYMEVMKARHLVYTALARAMDDIEEDLDAYQTTNYPAWPTNYPSTQDPKSVDIYTGDAPNVIPRPLFLLSRKLASPGEVDAINGSSIRDDQAEWADNPTPDPADYWIEQINPGGGRNPNGVITSIDGDQLTTAGIPSWHNTDRYRTSLPQWQEVANGGRIAYMVVNLSGLLDANEVGMDLRALGGDPSEIQLADLTEVNSVSALENHRNAVGFYERIADFVEGNGGLRADPQNFSAYSRFPADMRPNDLFGNGPVDVSVSVAALQAQKSDIIEAFGWSITPNPDPAAGVLPPLDRFKGERLYENLIDYVDEDNVPGSAVAASGATSGPYVDRAPMINELFVTNSVRMDALGVVQPGSLIRIWVECWYPFMTPQNEVFTLEYNLVFNQIAGPPGMLPSTPVPKSQPLAKVPFSQGFHPYVVPAGITNTPAAQALDYEITFQDVRIKDADGTEVDRIPDTKVKVVVPPQGVGVWLGGAGADVIDPRFNWTPQHWLNNLAYPYEYSIGNVNQGTENFITENAGKHSCCDADTQMYIANRELRSVGELAYLAYPGLHSVFPVNQLHPDPDANIALPWRTLRPFDNGLGRWERFFDHFAFGSNAVEKGKVNPNSEMADVLAAVYDGMRRDDYPEQGSAPKLNWARALAVGDAIIAHSGTNDFKSVSDLGRAAVANTMFAAAGIGANASEFERESVYRNAHGLFHTRQNLFAILLAGKSPIAVEQRALALVWRDPVPDANGHHPSFIRWFTWLEK